MAEELLKLERKTCKNPPRTYEQNTVEGLRGGAIVLMVAAWESFLKQLVEDELTILTTQPPKIKFDELPTKMQIHSIFQTLDRATKGPRYQHTDRIDRLADIDQACRLIISGVINPLAFSDTDTNPSPKVIRNMFSNIGIEDIFMSIKPEFERKWDQPVDNRFIEVKLQQIIHRRHLVAHKADTLGVSRKDLNEAVRFMKIIAPLFEKQLKTHVKSLSKKSP
jgi:hypothetical protein